MKNSDTENIKKVQKRFSTISIKKGFISTLLILIPAFIGFFILQNELNLSGTWEGLIIGYIIYVIPFLLIIWMFRGSNYSFISIFTGGSQKVSQIITVIPLLSISIGMVWMVILLLNLISVETAGNYLNWINNAGAFNLGQDATLLQYVLFWGLISIVAPVVEEVIFRGIMIERLGAKYSYGRAIVISSAIFGVLHPSPIGAFIVGVVLSLVYLKTRSLKIPILIHIANNAIAAFFMIVDERFFFTSSSWETVGPYISNAWVGILFFTVGVVWISWYIKENYQNVMEKEPFKLEIEKTESAT